VQLTTLELLLQRRTPEEHAKGRIQRIPPTHVGGAIEEQVDGGVSWPDHTIEHRGATTKGLCFETIYPARAR